MLWSGGLGGGGEWCLMHTILVQVLQNGVKKEIIEDRGVEGKSVDEREERGNHERHGEE